MLIYIIKVYNILKIKPDIGALILNGWISGFCYSLYGGMTNGLQKMSSMQPKLC